MARGGDTQAARVSAGSKSVMAPLTDGETIVGLVGMTVDRTAQIEIENRLKESEARLTAAIDALPFPFFVCDADGRHVMQNRSDRELWGDAIGKTFAETGLPQEIIAHMPRALARVRAGETVRELLRYRCNGELRDIEEIYAPVRTEKGIAGFVGLAIDHTDRVTVERRLAEAEARLKAAIDALPFPFFISDLDGRHLVQNPVDRAIWDDAIGKTLFELNLPDELVAHVPAAIARVRAGETVHSQLCFERLGCMRHEEEVYAPVYTAGVVTGFVSLTIDHTERVEAAARVRESEARLADHLATASDWLWETDDTHRIVSLSGWPAHFKISPETLLGRTRWDFAGVDSATDPAWQKHVADMEAGRPFRRFVYAYSEMDDPRVWIEVSGNPVFDAAGVFRGYRGTARDVTEQRHAEQALREAHAKLEAMTNSGLIGVTSGRGFLIEEANDAFLKLIGFDRSVLAGGLDWRQLVPPETKPDEVAAAKLRRATGDVYTTETAYRRADGRFVPVLLNSVVLDGIDQRWFALIQDLTPMKLAEARMRELAERDPLTGLANRHVLFERLAGDLGERRIRGTEGALMLLDLDRFKEINDSHGHEAGDQLLCLIGDRLKTVLRDTDTIARVGGDEFAVIVRGLREAANAADVAEKILAALRAPMSLDERLVRPDGSIGICLFPANGREPADLMKKADIALYAAKAAGRSTFRFFEPALVTQINQRRQIRDALKQANAEESFSIELQPQVHLGTGRHVGLEALARWQLDGKPLMPRDFIGLAEETGLIVQLGRIIRRQALEATRCLDQAGLAVGRLAVNVGIVELERPDFATELHELLQELAIAPDRLAIELSETMLIDHRIDGVGGNLEALRCLGVSLMLDDFGSGHASLPWLRRLAFDGLKIDRCLIRQIDAENGDGSLVRGIIDMAHAMDLTVVAEGVETAAQLAFLAHHGCDIAQGFHLAAPLTLGDLAGYLQAGETPLGRAQ